MARGRILHEISLDKIAAVDFPCQDPARAAIIKRSYTENQRKEMAAKGQALPDGSFPVANESDLHNAIQAIGRASDKAAAKAHIIARAKDLGAVDTLPEAWNVSITKEEDMTDAEKMAALQKSVDEMTSNLAKAVADLAKANSDHAVTSTELAKAKKDLEDLKDGGADDAMEDKDGKVTKKGLDFLAKHAPAGADEILKVGDASISKRAVGDQTFAFMKAQQLEIAKERELRVDAEMSKRAESDFGSLVGTAAEKGAILKHLSTAPESVQKAADAIFKAAEKATKSAFETAGTGGGHGIPADLAKARQDFMAKVNEIKSRDKISKTDALSKAASEHPALYKAYQGETSEVEAA